MIPDGTPRPVADDPVIDYRPTTWPGSRLPHFAVVYAGETISVHVAVSPHGFTLFCGTQVGPTWRQAVRNVAGTLRMTVICLVIGPGPDADLRDPADVWPALSEVERTGRGSRPARRACRMAGACAS